MKKQLMTERQNEAMMTLTGLPQASLADVRGGSGEPNPDQDNEARAQIIEVG